MISKFSFPTAITFGIEHRAIKVGETYYDKEHMVLFLQ